MPVPALDLGSSYYHCVSFYTGLSYAATEALESRFSQVRHLCCHLRNFALKQSWSIPDPNSETFLSQNCFVEDISGSGTRTRQ